MPKWIIQTSRLLSFSHPAIGTVGLTEEETQQTYGKENIKVYTSQFASMYTAVTQHRQQAKFKLITAGPEEKVVGLHGLGYGVDEMIQGFCSCYQDGSDKSRFRCNCRHSPNRIRRICDNEIKK